MEKKVELKPRSAGWGTLGTCGMCKHDCINRNKIWVKTCEKFEQTTGK